MKVIHTRARDQPGDAADLLERSDFVSLHCPLTPETHHLIDAAALAQMRANRDPDQHRPRPDRRPGGARAGAAATARSPAPRSTSPIPSRSHADDPLLERAEPDRRAAHRLGHASRARADDRARRREPARRARRAGRCPTRSTLVTDARRVVDIGTQLDAAADRRRARTAASRAELERRATVTRLGAGVDAGGRLARRRDGARVRDARGVPRADRAPRRRAPARGADQRRPRRRQRRRSSPTRSSSATALSRTS